jgi:hypothetical protein
MGIIRVILRLLIIPHINTPFLHILFLLIKIFRPSADKAHGIHNAIILQVLGLP